ncbi:Fic family protein [Lacticaseibacillus paracasei]|uniref:Fido domain-containing protein n=1 Tax=Lacticaseibacillus paracasei TaxID=1597 RepID=A0ABD7BQS9_LACPA|nr:Fic family protein [Lacticaseibacillus paracasei]QOP54950.1 hypothetical protein HCJ88_03815 [Lacticaseibacillus paracasei]QPB56515.1 hypothetical protein GFB64_05115 [Lacticaseibacillus paracasei]WPQ31577.1 Fic family protein [Lacticaseibacillus paracasei]
MEKKYVLFNYVSNKALIDLAHVALNGSNYELKGTEVADVYNSNDEWIYELKNGHEVIKSFFVIPNRGGKFLDVSALGRVNEQAESMFHEDSLYGIKDTQGLDRIVSSIFNGFGEEEFYPGVLRKATAYWYKLATTQMFYNGNKRTALFAAMQMLVSNGFVLNNLDGNDLYNKTVAIAAKQLSKEDLWEYVLKNTSPKYFKTKRDALNSESWIHFNFKMDKGTNLN